MKKGILIGILVLTLAALLAMGSWAYFTDSVGPIVNSFKAGTVKIEIDEHGFKDVAKWTPGKTSTKKVSIKSEGTKASYVRVSLTPLWGHLDEGEFVAEPGLPVDNVELLFASNYSDNWVYSEGWYYYRHILAAGAETPLLLKSVTLIEDKTGEEYEGKVLHIVVDAEAVQASHEAYKKVWGLDNLPDGVEPWEQ